MSYSLFELHETDIDGKLLGASLLSRILMEKIGEQIEGVIFSERKIDTIGFSNDISFQKELFKKYVFFIESIYEDDFPFFRRLSEDAKKLFMYMFEQKGQPISGIDLLQIVKDLGGSCRELQEVFQKENIPMRILKQEGIYILGSSLKIEPLGYIQRTFPKLHGNEEKTIPEIKKPTHHIRQKKLARGKKKIKFYETGNIEDIFLAGTILRDVLKYFIEYENTPITLRQLCEKFPDVSYPTLNTSIFVVRHTLEEYQTGKSLKNVRRGVYLYGDTEDRKDFLIHK